MVTRAEFYEQYYSPILRKRKIKHLFANAQTYKLPEVANIARGAPAPGPGLGARAPGPGAKLGR